MHPDRLHTWKVLTTQNIATEMIDDRERIAVDPISHAKLAFDVDGPHLVWGRRLPWRRIRMLPMRAQSTTAHAIIAREDIEDGAAGRPRDRRLHGLQAFEDLSCTPPIPCVLRQDGLDDIRRRFIRRRPRRPTVLGQSRHAEREIPFAPFVSGVATDAVAFPQLRHRPQPAGEVLRKMMALQHGMGLLPGHRRLSEGIRKRVNHVPRLYRTMSNGALLLTAHGGMRAARAIS